MSGTLPESGFASPSERGGKAIFGWWRAERALSYGILSDVVPRDALEAEVEDEHPPVAPITTDGVNVRPRPQMDVPAAIGYARNLHAVPRRWGELCALARVALTFPPAVRLPPPTSRMAGTTDCLRIVIHFTKTKRVRLHELQNLPIDPWPLRLHQVQYKRLPLRRRRVQVPDRRVQPALSFQSVAN